MCVAAGYNEGCHVTTVFPTQGHIQMKTDLYTKTLLTVIAICLVCLVTQKDSPLLPTANAATVNSAAVQDVRIVGIAKGKEYDTPLSVQIVGISKSPTCNFFNLPVEIKK
jgi:hypothetical protein